MPADKVPILSFFCGAGGLDRGFHLEGFRVAAAFDNFSAAVQSYNLNAKPHVAHVTDLATITLSKLRDLIRVCAPDAIPQGVVGGPPCQGFSRANVQANPNDPRNQLPFKYAEILADLNKVFKLKFFVFENVMGLLQSKHSERFQAIRKAFEDAGFRVFYSDLNARDFGVPQFRRRLFLVGLNREQFPDTIFEFPTPGRKTTTVRNAIQDLPDPTFFAHGLEPDDIAHHPNHWTMRPRSPKLAEGAAAGGRSFRRLEWDEASPTVAYGNREIHVHPNGGRRLSVLEALLLQGFPKKFQLTGTFSEQVTQVSNAVPPPVARVLARKIFKTILDEAKE